MKKRRIVQTVIILILVLLAIALAIKTLSSEPVVSEDQQSQVMTPEPPSNGDLMPGLPEDASEEQKSAEVYRQIAEAQQVIEQQGVIKPLNGPIYNRPEFVSMFEWELMQFAIENQGLSASSAEFTDLVNLLRFNKLLEYWEGLSVTNDPAKAATRRALAAQLLVEFPGWVAAGKLSSQDFARLEPMLQADLAR